jgi:glycine/D-amino acid oxidase-like deaminating enzyme
MSTGHFQDLIIGSGVAGKIIAWTLASQGHKTVVVERAMVGGSCPNVACQVESASGLHRACADLSVSWNLDSTEGGKTMADLQSRLDEFKKAFESGAPPYNAPRAAIETTHRATAELKATGLESLALKVGDRAPEFSLFNQDHVQVNSAELLRQGPLIVTFFRGHW